MKKKNWSDIVRIMNTQKVSTVNQQAQTKDISLRLCSKPINEVEMIYNDLDSNNSLSKPKYLWHTIKNPNYWMIK